MSALPEQAAVFLAQFSGRHTFQTFDDRPAKEKQLSRILHSPARLDALNKQGAGVFLMVNEGDGLGRLKSDVIRIRAYFADFDGQALPDHWALEPSMLIESSPHKFHAYWILEEDERPPLDNAAFNAQQEALAVAVGSCPDDGKGLNRVMRLAGYLHQKAEPFTSRLLSTSGERFTLAQIQAAFPLPSKPQRPATVAAPIAPTGKPTTQQETQRKYALTTLDELQTELSNTPEQGRNNKLNAAAFQLGRLVGGGHLTESEVRAALSQAASWAGLPEDEVSTTLHSALTAGMADPNELEQVGQLTGKGKPSAAKQDSEGKQATEDKQTEEEAENSKRPPAGTRVLEYAVKEGAELWHDQSGNAFITATSGQHREHYPLPSRAARDYLKALYWEHEQRALGAQALQEALGLMEALARRQGVEHQTAVRVAHLDGQTYLDLGTESWEVAEVGRGYWKIIKPHECPLRFTRPRGFLPLPTPELGGNLSELQAFISTDQRGLMMCTAWMLGALSGLSPYPVLALSGEQGSGKSTGGSNIKNLLDPTEADRRRAPKQEHDLFIAAQAAHILSFDNLSSIPAWMSDALCTISTGGAFAARELYSGTEETVLRAVRPVIVNGIPDLLARPDLAERALTVTFKRAEHRLPEQVLAAQYQRARPRLLGALLTALAEGLRNLETTQLEHSPRLADFARLIVAAEPCLPWELGAFLKAYGEMQGEAASTVLDGEPVAEALRGLMDGLAETQEWRGTVKGLLEALNDQEGYPDQHRPPQGWPRTARAFGAALRRLAPALRKTGYDVTPEGRGKEGEKYSLRKKVETTYTTYTTYTGPLPDGKKQGVHWEPLHTPETANVHPPTQAVYVGDEAMYIGQSNVHPKNSVSDGAGVGGVCSVRSIRLSLKAEEWTGETKL